MKAKLTFRNQFFGQYSAKITLYFEGDGEGANAIKWLARKFPASDKYTNACGGYSCGRWIANTQEGQRGNACQGVFTHGDALRTFSSWIEEQSGISPGNLSKSTDGTGHTVEVPWTEENQLELI